MGLMLPIWAKIILVSLLVLSGILMSVTMILFMMGSDERKRMQGEDFQNSLRETLTESLAV